MTRRSSFSFRPTMWMKVILFIVAAYVGICVLLFFAQRRMMYLPSAGAFELPTGFTEWRSPNGSEFWGYKRVFGTNACLFFFHGNGGNASGWAHAVDQFPGDIFVLEYPGYGQRPGVPSEETIKAAARAAFEANHAPYEQVIVAGQSLGAGATEAIFSSHPDKISRLVLITPFTSIADVARDHFPWVPTSLILRDRYELYDAWRKFPGKTSVVIAGRDEIIPARHGRKYLQAKGDLCEVITHAEDSHNSIELDADFWRKAMD